VLQDLRTDHNVEGAVRERQGECVTAEERRTFIDLYDAEILFNDAQFGRLMAAVEREWGEDHLVALTADHGDHNGQFGWFFKGTMYDGAARVPLIVSDPTSNGPDGRVSERVVNNLDLFATVLDRAGIDSPYDTASRSLCRLLDSPAAADWPDETIVELGNDALYANRDHKLLHRGGDAGPFYELYERDGRPTDATNRWEDPGWRDRQRELVDRLEDRQASLEANGLS